MLRNMDEKHEWYFVVFHLMETCFKELLYIANMGKYKKGGLDIS
jgi:hypothetical protein